MKLLRDVSIEELKSLMDAQNLANTEEMIKYPLTDKLKQHLMAIVVKDNISNPFGKLASQELLSYHFISGECACMGKYDDAPYCSCIMQNCLNLYKFHIAMAFKTRVN